MSQLELFTEPSVQVSPVPTVDSIRERLETLLEPLRNASAMPWSSKQAALWKLVVPQMTDWLPAEEREQMRAEFDAHIERLETRAA